MKTSKVNVITHPVLGDVRSVVKNGVVWFVAKDVCDVLGIANSRDTLSKSLDDNEKGVDTIYTLKGNQEVSTVNESGLYSLIFQSRKPEAKQFRKWVTSEVLPAIRRQGFYVNPNTQLTAIEQRKIEKVMRDGVERYVTREDVWNCHKKFRVDTLKINMVLAGRVSDMAIMAYLQECALKNRERLDSAYSPERMQEVINKLSK